MKKMLFSVVCVLLLACFSLDAFASGGDEIMKNIPAEIEDLMPSGATAEEVAGGVTVGYVFSAATKVFKRIFPSAAREFAEMLGLIVLSSVVGAIRDGTGREDVREVLSYVCAVCVCASAYSLVCGIFDEVRKLVGALGTFLRVLIPTLAALSAASGGVAFSSAAGGVLYGAITVLESLCEGAVFPILRVCICISLGATALGNESLAHASASLKKTLTLVLSFIMLVFSFVLGFRGILAKSADTVTLKSVKFAAASIIPVVGSAVGDAAGSVFVGVAAVKSAVGTVGAVILVLILLSPLAKVFIYKVMFEFSSVAAGMLGLEKEGKIIAEMGSICGFLMAALSCVAVFFLIAVGIFSSVGA